MLVKSNNIESPYLNFDDTIFVPQKNVSANQYLKNGDIVITRKQNLGFCPDFVSQLYRLRRLLKKEFVCFDSNHFDY